MRYDSQTGKAALCRRGGLRTAAIYRALGFPNLKNGSRGWKRVAAIRRAARLEAELEATRRLILELS